MPRASVYRLTEALVQARLLELGTDELARDVVADRCDERRAEAEARRGDRGDRAAAG